MYTCHRKTQTCTVMHSLYLDRVLGLCCGDLCIMYLRHEALILCHRVLHFEAQIDGILW